MIIIKKLFLIILFLLPISISSFKYKTTFFNSEVKIKESNAKIIYVKDKNIYLDLEDYIIGVVAAEMPALFNEEALKAQAVASRSYVLSQNKNNIISISSTKSDQVYQDNYELLKKWGNNYSLYYEKISKAVNDTKGEVISRDNKILKTYYFSMSNGKTENSQNVFKENTFISVESSLENESLKNFIKTISLTEKELLEKLNLTYISINNISRNETDHVNIINISGRNFSGIEIRKLLNLRSTDFTIKKDDDNNYLITTKGYGHGVGMSQYGANEMGKQGNDYREILNHYYQNTKIIKL